MTPRLVDAEVTLQKFQREFEHWKRNSRHQERGWLLLSNDEAVPAVEIAFLARIAISAGAGLVPIVVCAIRLTYENYDVWPPSLTFIDAFTRQPSRPHVRAFLSTPNGPQDVLIDAHPMTGQPFVCLPGIREYHSHPQHSGDDWLLHRSAKDGNLLNICERIWRLMARNVVGLNVAMQALPVWPLQAQLVISLAQGEIMDGPPPAPPKQLDSK